MHPATSCVQRICGGNKWGRNCDWIGRRLVMGVQRKLLGMVPFGPSYFLIGLMLGKEMVGPTAFAWNNGSQITMVLWGRVRGHLPKKKKR
jgi:hypothetical protein